MATIGRANLPVPAGGNSPTVPADIAALAEAVDPHLRHTVTNKAQRDTLFADAPAHTLVTADDGSMWLKVSSTSNTWVSIYEAPEAWRPLPLASGFTAGEQAPEIRRIGTHVWMRGRVQRVDGAVIFNLSATKIAQVPADCVPLALASGAAGQSVVGDPVTGVGRIEVLATGWERPEGGAGSVLWYSQDGTGSTWVGCDLEYWID
ncbi:hypothetical protein ACIQPP_05640 [Streptomyces violaceusniger]|uniref:hypothetical protein n=1 Tax=Streptomyces violaceusniger TaxID=68280 RepID=UPI0009C35E1F|nr:hypothetical protein [Streptomyces hygroscopicus]AQW55303.1 hypothetical protein SHXM_08766 [Streptomyces hygroscopicus]